MGLYGPLLKKRGYDVKFLDLVHPEKSDYGYDPVLHVKDDSDLMALGQSIMSCTKTVSAREPYWENSACGLFCAIVEMARIKYERKPGMREVLHLLYHIDEPEISLMCGSNRSEDEEWYEEYDEKVTLDDEFELLKYTEPRMYANWRQYNNNAAVTKTVSEVFCLRQSTR